MSPWKRIAAGTYKREGWTITSCDGYQRAPRHYLKWMLWEGDEGTFCRTLSDAKALAARLEEARK